MTIVLRLSKIPASIVNDNKVGLPGLPTPYQPNLPNYPDFFKMRLVSINPQL